MWAAHHTYTKMLGWGKKNGENKHARQREKKYRQEQWEQQKRSVADSHLLSTQYELWIQPVESIFLFTSSAEEGEHGGGQRAEQASFKTNRLVVK